jgi:WD40 repeat protein
MVFAWKKRLYPFQRKMQGVSLKGGSLGGDCSKGADYCTLLSDCGKVQGKNEGCYKGVEGMKKLLLFVIVSGIVFGMEKDGKGKEEIGWQDEVVQNNTNQPTYETATFITVDKKEIELTKAEIDRLPLLKNLIEDLGADNPILLSDSSATFHTLSALKELMNAMPKDLFVVAHPLSEENSEKQAIENRIAVINREIEKKHAQINDIEQSGKQLDDLKKLALKIRGVEKAFEQSVDENQQQLLGQELHRLREKKGELEKQDIERKKFYKNEQDYKNNVVLYEKMIKKNEQDKLVNEKKDLEQKLSLINKKSQISNIDLEVLQGIKEIIKESAPKTFLPCLQLTRLGNWLDIDANVQNELMRYLAGLDISFNDFDSIIKNKIVISKRLARALVDSLYRDDRALVRTLNLDRRVSGVAFSPDGTLLASGSFDKTIKLWNPQTGECIRTLVGHTKAVLSVAFSSDGKCLASTSQDQMINLWNPQTGECIRTFFGGDYEGVCKIAFSPDGTLLAAASNRSITLWNPQTGRVIITLHGHGDWIICIAFSPDGTLLASGSFDKTIKLWNPQTGECIRTLEGDGKEVVSIAFSPDGSLLASSSFPENKNQLKAQIFTSNINLWDPQTGVSIRNLDERFLGVRSIAFNHAGTLLASTAYHAIKLWDPQTGASIRKLGEGDKEEVLRVVFSPYGNLLASVTQKAIKLWHIGLPPISVETLDGLQLFFIFYHEKTQGMQSDRYRNFYYLLPEAIKKEMYSLSNLSWQGWLHSKYDYYKKPVLKTLGLGAAAVGSYYLLNKYRSKNKVSK